MTAKWKRPPKLMRAISVSSSRAKRLDHVNSSGEVLDSAPCLLKRTRRSTQHMNRVDAYGFLRQRPMVGVVPHFAPSGAPREGQNTDTTMHRSNPKNNRRQTNPI